MDKKLLADLKSDYNHYVIRYPDDVESRLIALMHIKQYEGFSEQEIRRALKIVGYHLSR